MGVGDACFQRTSYVIVIENLGNKIIINAIFKINLRPTSTKDNANFANSFNFFCCFFHYGHTRQPRSITYILWILNVFEPERKSCCCLPHDVASILNVADIPAMSISNYMHQCCCHAASLLHCGHPCSCWLP
jgi:hypothetical protein